MHIGLTADSHDRALRPRLAAVVGVSLIAVLGLALRCAFIGQESLWFDEAWSWRSAHLSIRELWTEALDLHPPLYYTLQHVWLAFGESEAAMRSLSAMFGTCSVVLAYFLGRSLLDVRTGLVAALLTATSALQVAYSQEARSYSLLTMTALLVSLAMVRILRLEPDGLRKAPLVGLGYVLASLAALYTHNLAALLLVVAGVFGLLRAMQARSARFVALWCALNGLVLLGWAWWLPVIASQAQGSILAWQAPLTLDVAVADLRSVYGEPLVWHLQLFADLLLPGLAVTGAIMARRLGLAAFYLIAAAFAIPAAEIAISFAGKAIFMARSIVWLAPIYFVLAAVPFSRLRAVFRLPLLAVVVGMQLVAVYHYYSVGPTNYVFPHKDEPWRSLVSYLVPRVCAGDVILLMPKVYEAPFSYYSDSRVPSGVAVLGVDTSRSRLLSDPRLLRLPAVDIGAIGRISEATNRIWLVGRQTPDAGGAEREAMVRERLLRARVDASTHVDRNLRADLLVKPDSVNGPGCRPPAATK